VINDSRFVLNILSLPFIDSLPDLIPKDSFCVPVLSLLSPPIVPFPTLISGESSSIGAGGGAKVGGGRGGGMPTLFMELVEMRFLVAEGEE
jgi:hypothetical protein